MTNLNSVERNLYDILLHQLNEHMQHRSYLQHTAKVLGLGGSVVLVYNKITSYAGYPSGSCLEVFYEENGQAFHTEIFHKEKVEHAVLSFIRRLSSEFPSKPSGLGQTYAEVFGTKADGARSALVTETASLHGN